MHLHGVLDLTYISPRARIADNSLVSPNTVILGETVIGENTFIGDYVVIGFPKRRTLRKLLLNPPKHPVLSLLDNESKGARIGKNTIIRPFTTIYEDSVIGDNVETGHNVLIREETRIGSNTIVGTGTIIDGYTVIGNNVRIESGVYIPPKTIIEDNVFLGPRVVVTNDKYPVSKRLVGVVIRKGAVIGANTVLIAGVEVGEEAVVAAGSIVTRNVPPRTVVMGSPAKPVMTREEYEEKKRKYEKQ